MPEREVAPDAERPRAVVYQLARDVVDRRDVVGVAEAEVVGEECRAEEDGVRVKGRQRPDPGAQIRGREGGIEADDAAANRGLGGGAD